MPDTLNTVVCEPTLTPRERQVLTLLAGGETYWGIGRRLGISPHTVDTHLRCGGRAVGGGDEVGEGQGGARRRGGRGFGGAAVECQVEVAVEEAAHAAR
ncbi:response regulator transcription factor [Streptomyces sp. BE133]|uniref:response regulator transcription factor n=1 Tax=Streptomyces sp. BE133 TaxID=3002523 RepID=UPI002E784035|nr:helix-turn-helix transcriptional regulator [Streptomyces sp. BE133]MEE1813308.1 helix-turn-helix transcriptional regulator [Streptomyces sp. BE133]